MRSYGQNKLYTIYIGLYGGTCSIRLLRWLHACRLQTCSATIRLTTAPRLVKFLQHQHKQRYQRWKRTIRPSDADVTFKQHNLSLYSCTSHGWPLKLCCTQRCQNLMLFVAQHTIANSLARENIPVSPPPGHGSRIIILSFILATGRVAKKKTAAIYADTPYSHLAVWLGLE